MEIQIEDSANKIFTAIYQSSINVDVVVNAALSRGIDQYQKGNYETSLEEFKRVAALSPNTENAAKAYNFQALSYIRLGRTEDAINAYKSAIKISSSDDSLHISLGNVFFDLKRYDEAEKEYETAIKINSQSITNWYSLGQTYIETQKYEKAEDAFRKIIQLSPQNYSGYYGLGKLSYKLGKYEEAIKYFQKTLELKRDFNYAYVDIGYAYADMGDIDSAKAQLKILNNLNDTDSASLLDSYIYQKSSPEFFAVYNTDGFITTLGPNTSVSSLDPSLSQAGSSSLFTMNFIFNKDMDPASVRNIINWQISRAPATSPGGGYNWGMPLAPTEVCLLPHPLYVIYNEGDLTAQVIFQISQNSSADATIDPSHIYFKFTGKDIYGNSMDDRADEFSGLSLIV